MILEDSNKDNNAILVFLCVCQLFMDLEHMDLVSKPLGNTIKFADWNKRKEQDWSVYRLAYGFMFVLIV